MADVTRTVEVLFYGNDKISQAVKKIHKSIGTLDAGVQSVAQPLSRVADGILALDAALAALAIGGLTYAVSKSIEFENASIELEKVLGEESGRLKEMQQHASDLAFQYGESSNSILLSSANFKQAGFDASGAMLLTKDALDLVIAGELEASESSELLIANLKGFKAPAEDASRLIDILNEVSNNYATDIRQLAIGMAKLSPVANQMGFSMEETAGILTPVIEVFRSGNEAATALKTGLLKLVDDSKPVQEALEALGVSQRKTNGELKSGKELLFEVSTAFQTAKDSDKAFLTQQLVGIQQSARMIEVFNGLNTALEVTATAQRSAGSAAQEVTLRLASAEVQINRVKVGWKELNRVAGDQFRASIGESAGAFADLEKSIFDAIDSGAFSEFFDAINDWSKDLAEWLKDITKAVPDALKLVDFNSFVQSLKELGGEFGAIFEGIDLTTPEGLASAVQGVINTLESLARVTQGMVHGFEILFDFLGEGIERFNNLTDAEKVTAGEFLAGAKIIVAAGAKIGLALIAIGQSGTDVANVYNVLIGGIKTGWNLLQVAFDQIMILGTELVNAFLWIADKATLITRPFSDLNDKIKAARASVQDFLEGAKQNQFENMQDLIDGAGQAWDGLTGSMEETGKTAREVKAVLNEAVPESKDVEITIDKAGNIEAAGQKLKAAIPETITTEIIVKQNDGSILLTNREIKDRISEDETVTFFSTPDKESIEKSKQQVSDEFKAHADLLETQIEWGAKVDISKVEAAAERYTETMRGVNLGLENTTELMTAAFDKLSGGSFQQRWEARKVVESENKLREQSFELQRKLTEAQLDIMEAKRRAIENGEALIKIEAEGLEPALELVLYEIIKKVQILANEESSEMLLGLI